MSCCPDAQSTLCAIVICAVRVRHRHALSSQEEDESHRDESGNEDTATSGRRHGSACTQPGSTVAAPTRGALVRWCAGAQVRRCAVGSSQLHEVQDYSCIHRPYRLQLCVLRSQYRSRTPGVRPMHSNGSCINGEACGPCSASSESRVLVSYFHGLRRESVTDCEPFVVVIQLYN